MALYWQARLAAEDLPLMLVRIVVELTLVYPSAAFIAQFAASTLR